MSKNYRAFLVGRCEEADAGLAKASKALDKAIESGDGGELYYADRIVQQWEHESSYWYGKLDEYDKGLQSWDF